MMDKNGLMTVKSFFEYLLMSSSSILVLIGCFVVVYMFLTEGGI